MSDDEFATEAATEAQVGVERLRGLRIALIWGRIGPYHLARAQAASDYLRTVGASLILAEVCGRDNYAWETSTMVRPDWVSTLVNGRDYGSLGRREISDAARSWLEENNPDVVAINGWGVPEARAAFRWIADRNRRAVVMSETKYDDDLPRRWWKEWLKRRIVSRAHSGLVGGRPHRDYLSSLGVPLERIFLGYNAVDNNYFARGTAEESFRDRQINGKVLVPGSPYLLASSRFIVRKNLDGLLRAYAVYRQQLQEEAWPLVIAGSGPEGNSLRQLSVDLGIDESVTWPGFVQYAELPHLYHCAGAFIHPARVEPWGLVVNEAAAASVPLLVAKPVGSCYELVEEGVSGYTFDPYSETEMVNAMVTVTLLADERRRMMGEAARRRVEAFGPGRFAVGLAAAAVSALDA